MKVDRIGPFRAWLETTYAEQRAEGLDYVLLVVPTRRGKAVAGVSRVPVAPGLVGVYRGDCERGSLVDLDLADVERWLARRGT